MLGAGATSGQVPRAANMQVFTAYLARAADGDAGSGKRMMADENVGQAEHAAERPRLVLEQFAQRLAQRNVHALRQPAEVLLCQSGDNSGIALDPDSVASNASRRIRAALIISRPMRCE
jgi:hypothetical protein